MSEGREIWRGQLAAATLQSTPGQGLPLYYTGAGKLLNSHMQSLFYDTGDWEISQEEAMEMV